MVHYVVVGGGVAGVCCVEELCALCPEDTVTLVSNDKTLKASRRRTAATAQSVCSWCPSQSCHDI